MRPREAFLADICEHPDDDGPRLIFADWLEDNGDEAERAHAEFIRLECRLASLEEKQPERPRLEERRRQLLFVYENAWRGLLPKLSGVHWGGWERGFIVDVSVAHAKAFREHGDTLFAAAPVRRLSFGSRLTARTLLQLTSSPHLARLDALSIYGSPIGAAGAAALAGSPHLSGLACLDIGLCRLGDAGIEWLAASLHLRNLRYIGLCTNGIGPDGAKALAKSPILNAVTELRLQSNMLGDAGTRELASSPRLDALRTLWLSCNAVTDEGAEAIAGSRHLPNLTELYLVYNRIGDAGAKALANSPHRGRLTALHLGANRIGPEGAQALAAATGLSGLVKLTLYDYDHDIGDEGEAALRERYGERLELAPAAKG